jgi:hypothetical protein
VYQVLVASFQTGQLHRPDLVVAVIAAAGHFLMIVACVVGFLRTSYPSNHASGSNSAAEILRRIYGAGGHSITLENAALPDVILHYTTFKQITDDIDAARVYGGIHFRFDQEAGGRLGRDIATFIYKNNLRGPNDSE